MIWDACSDHYRKYFFVLISHYEDEDEEYSPKKIGIKSDKKIEKYEAGKYFILEVIKFKTNNQIQFSIQLWNTYFSRIFSTNLDLQYIR